MMPLRKLTATLLRATGEGLGLASSAVKSAAQLLYPPAEGEHGEAAGEVAAQLPPRTETTGRVDEPPVARASASRSHTRVPETHTDELAGRPAAEVVEVVPTLSTDELRRLYEHESAHKKRKTVLEAIERQAAPSPARPLLTTPAGLAAQ